MRKNEIDSREVHQPSRYSHTVLKTKRYTQMIEWYNTVLGARTVFRSERISLITFDEEHHRLGFMNVDDLIDKPKFSTGLHHTSYTYDDLGELFATYRRLATSEILPRWCINHGLTMSFYYADPDGNFVELQFENFGNVEDSMEYMQESEEFRENPNGCLFDPETLIERFESGESVEKLVLRQYRDNDPSPLELLAEMGLYNPK